MYVLSSNQETKSFELYSTLIYSVESNLKFTTRQNEEKTTKATRREPRKAEEGDERKPREDQERTNGEPTGEQKRTNRDPRQPSENQ